MQKLFIVMLALLLSACASVSPGIIQQAHIVRDDFGVPHIYAADVYGLYYGYGYAVAQDRLFQMEMTRRSTQGRVAEVLGADFLDYDKGTRKLFDPASIRHQLAALAPGERDIFTGFAAGMNAWLREIRSRPEELMPRQFIDYAFEPADWSAYDVAMIFIGTMANRYGDFNTELDNLKIYQSLLARHGKAQANKLFDLLNPRFTTNAPTTIPAADWSVQMPDSLRSATDPKAAPVVGLSDFGASYQPAPSGMSNCIVLGSDKVEGASSILVNGPQFGWFNPAYVYSVGLHGAGIDVVGNTPFAYPVIMFGHNRIISWGSTWGAGDIVDIYAEQLNPDNPRQYLYQGGYRDFERRVELIQVRDADPVRLEVYRSVHGPVFQGDPAAGVMYARQRAWDGIELETLLAWINATRAGDYESWEKEAAKSAINVNMYFADVHGNIGYFYGGRYPQRAAGHDNRFPVTGDGSMDWLGRMPISQANPHVKNPVSGFIANWNNKPGQGVMNPDFHFFSWSEADRVDILHDAIVSQDRFTADQAWSLIEMSSYADVHAPYLLPMVDAAVRANGDERLRAANRILQRWDGLSLDADRDGFYDGAATAIFRVFAGALLKAVLSDDLAEVFAPFSFLGYPTADTPTGAGTNIQTGMKAVIESLRGHGEYDLLNGESPHTVIIRALGEALDGLESGQGDDPQAQRLQVAARPFSIVNFLGVPQAGADELKIAPIEQNRGTENDMIVMRENAIIGWEVTPPGQNAFISPAAEKTVHYDDQFGMYTDFGRKRMWFYPADVEANKATEEIIRYAR